MERTDSNSRLAHQQLVEKAKQGKIDVYFVGDSITRRWGATDYPDFLAHWRESFWGWNAANFGWGGDRTQNILWRLRNGELESLRPKAFVILAGTNNLTPAMTADDIRKVADGVLAIVKTCREASPDATIILMALFPRGDFPQASNAIDQLNAILQTFENEPQVRFLNINKELIDNDGKPQRELFPDQLHPSLAAYQKWAEALKPILTEVLGPPALEDQAPPATGDPSTMRR